MIGRAETARATSRRRAFVRDFRWSWSQTLRAALDLTFVPLLEKHFEIDRRTDADGRFQEAHYARLGQSLGCLAYGGFIGYPVPQGSQKITVDTPVLGRWDSWRLWRASRPSA